MKKMKMGGGNAQEFLKQHVEKFALGIVLVLLLLLIYSGFSLESYKETPANLASTAQEIEAHVKRDYSEQLLKEEADKRVADTDYAAQLQRLSAVRLPELEPFYDTAKPWNPPIFRPYKKRTDPKLLAPMNLQAVAMSGPLALKAEGNVTDEIAALPDAPVAEQKPSRPARRERRGRGGGAGGDPYGGGGGNPYGGGGGLFGPGMGGPGMGGPGGPGAGGPGLGGAPGEEGGSDLLGGGAGAVVASGPTYGGPVEGYRPGAGGMAGMGQYGAGGGGAGASSGAVAMKATTFVAVKAVVPYEKQLAEYENSLAGSTSYSPQRDTPNYIHLQAQRADVTENPQASDDELKWEDITNTRSFTTNHISKWHGVPSQDVGQEYKIPAITFPLPPLMMRDLTPLMLHPDIPLRATRTDTTVAAQQPGQTTSSDEQGDSDLPQAGPAPGAAAGPYGGGAAGPLGGGAAAGPYGAGGGAGPYGAGGGAGPPGGGGLAGPPGGGGGNPYGGGAGMGSSFGAVGSTPSTEYKLVRFYDMQAKPGRKYRYRVRVWLEDPNRPTSETNAPDPRELSDEVLARINQVEQTEQQQARKTRIYWVQTDWSKPTDVVEVPQPHQVLLASVNPARTATVPGSNNMEIQLEESKVSLLSVVLDPKYSVDIPAAVETYRGAVLNLTTNAKIVHPATLAMKLLENYQLKTNTTVLDFRGGNALGSGDDALTAPGEILLMDSSGRLIVHNEIDQMELHNQFDYEAHASAAPAAAAGGPPGLGGAGGAAGGGGPYGAGGMGPYGAGGAGGGGPGGGPGGAPGLFGPPGGGRKK